MFTWEQDTDGVVVVTMNDPDQAVNTANDRFRAELPILLDRLERSRDEISGVILTSAKSTFFAGADLRAFADAGPSDIPDVHEYLDDLKRGFRRVERLGVPVVAAINGAALGGGCELSLACHYRIAVDQPKVLIGLPEVTLGLLPGAGGVVRTVRMFGIGYALDKILLPGTHFGPAGALDVGLIDQVVDGADELLPAARRWLSTKPAAVQPWDAEGYTIPGGSARDSKTAAILGLLPAKVRKQTRGRPAAAEHAIVATAVESTLVDFSSAETIESQYCAGLVGSQVASNIIQGTFFDLRTVRARSASLSNGSGVSVQRVLVLGENPIGRDIAQLCEEVGLDATLTDGAVDSLNGEYDLLLETIFDDFDVRAAMVQRVSRALGPDILIASNSSTTALSELAAFVHDPSRLVGLHLFTPIPVMKLAEVAVGAQTSEQARSTAIDLARKLGKTSIVVNDAPGFYANRVLGALLAEALTLVQQGVPPAVIEQAGYQAGFGSAFLVLSDAIGLETVRDLISRVVDTEGDEPGVPLEVLTAMIDKYRRTGRDAAAGFYEYANGRRSRLWTRLHDIFPPQDEPIPFTDIQERLLFAGALAARRCLDTGIVATVADGNVGSILGIGFPTWTGGALHYIGQYSGGGVGFRHRAEQLAASYGPRFEPVGASANL